jgi:hypothetical protein
LRLIATGIGGPNPKATWARFRGGQVCWDADWLRAARVDRLMGGMTVDGVFYSHLALVAVEVRVRRPRRPALSAGNSNLRGPSTNKGRSLLF